MLRSTYRVLERDTWLAVLLRSLGWALAVAAWLLLLVGLTTSAHALTTVRITTVLGDVDVTLYEDTAPLTADNFLDYVAADAYADMFLHRSVPGFVVQGGGFTFVPGQGVGNVPTFAPVQNEFNVSNTRGTVAMAKLGGDPDSATSQWFFNLDDNSDNLDNQNGGFTVFGRVVGDGMDTVDAIAALPRINAGGAFTNLPYRNQIVNNTVDENNLVFVTSVTVLDVMSGDYNGNGQIEQGDLDLVLQNWGAFGSELEVGLYGHGPGQIGQGSLDAVLTSWGEATAPEFTGSAVPEPVSGSIGLVAAVLAYRRRRQR